MKVGILAPKFNKENLCAFLMLTADGVVKGMRMELSSLLLMGMHIFFLFVFFTSNVSGFSHHFAKDSVKIG